MTVFQGVFQSKGSPEGRSPQRRELPSGRTARGRFSALINGPETVEQQ